MTNREDRPMTILLVEDNQDHAELALRALQDQEYEAPCQTFWMKNGQEALDFLQDEEKGDRPLPSIIILDIKLPKVTGIELLRKIKANRILSRIPVIMLTTSDRSEEMESCYKLGANSFIVKPVQFSDYIEKVRSVKYYWTRINSSLHLEKYAGEK